MAKIVADSSSLTQLLLLYSSLGPAMYPLFCPYFLAHVVSSLVYPNLLETKRLSCRYCCLAPIGFICSLPQLAWTKRLCCCCENNHIWKSCHHTTGKGITVHKASILTFSKNIEDTFTHQKQEIIVHKRIFIFCFQHTKVTSNEFLGLTWLCSVCS
jgi:hypothetical protein